MPNARSSIRILTLVEATTVNAVAKSVLAFYSGARDLTGQTGDFPGIEGSLVTFARRRAAPQSPNEFETATRKLDFEIDTIPERRRFDLGVIHALRAIVENRRPDIVVTHSVKSHFLLWRSQLWQKLPWVAFHHGYTTTDRKMRLYNRLDRWSLMHADRVITVCQAFANELASKTGIPFKNLAVLHNSIRLQPPSTAMEIQELRSRFRLGTDERIVLTIGRLSKEKAQIDLLAAFNRLRDTTPEIKCRLIIVGEGRERARLEAAAESFGRKADVIFAGQVSAVGPFYAAADVFVLPSHSEGSPNVLLEAMAAKLPIVVTKVGGVPEIVEHNESALLVAAADPPAMAAAIARLLTDGDLAQRLTANASALVATRFLPENYVRSLTRICREVIEARHVN